MNVFQLEPNPDFVAIELEVVADKTEGGIIIGEVAKDNIKKLQNRGTVKWAGKNCSWLKAGDFVSFYRGASTPITEGGNEYQMVAEDNVLAIVSYTDK